MPNTLYTYCCIVYATTIHICMQNTYWCTIIIITSEEFFKNIPLTLFERFVCVRGYIDPHSYGHQRCVFLVLQGCSTGVLGALSAGCGLSLPHLVSNLSDLQLTDFLFSTSYIIIQSPTQSLEWHVWSSSSGNNCHAVHRSLSSGASVYEFTMGFYLVP